jgi:hypothetical protein
LVSPPHQGFCLTFKLLDAALWLERHISQSARCVNMTKVRRWLGEDANSQQWLPPNMGDQRLFCRLRTRGEARGAAGATDLRRALKLVHGAPLDGCDRPYQAGGHGRHHRGVQARLSSAG